MTAIVICNFVLNLILIAGFFYSYSDSHPDPPPTEQSHWWVALLCLNGLLLIITATCLALTSIIDPGHIKPIPFDKFSEVLDRAIKEDRNLEYFCFFCRSIWSYSAMHCQICGKCVEGFDHHCYYVNNCIGFKNHSYFLSFLCFGLFYILLSGSLLLINIYESCYSGHEKPGHEKEMIILIISALALIFDFLQFAILML